MATAAFNQSISKGNVRSCFISQRKTSKRGNGDGGDRSIAMAMGQEDQGNGNGTGAGALGQQQLQ
jgi:hypothetical protein